MIKDRLLLDTDILLDFFFDRKPFSDGAAALLTLCEKRELQGFITPLVVSNLYSLLRMNSRHDFVLQKLSELLLIVDILSMDNDVIKNALNSKFSDFEDALQHFAAVKYGKVDVIITRNLRDFKRSDIIVMDPNAYLSHR